MSGGGTTVIGILSRLQRWDGIGEESVLGFPGLEAEVETVHRASGGRSETTPLSEIGRASGGERV